MRPFGAKRLKHSPDPGGRPAISLRYKSGMHSNHTPLQQVLSSIMNPSVDLATETQAVVPTHKLRCGDTLHDAGGGGVNVGARAHAAGWAL